MDREAYLDRIEAKLREHGVSVQYVQAPQGEVSFAYTVGLFVLDHPEFLMFDLPAELAHALLNDMAFAVLRAGLRFSHADRVHGLIQDGYVSLLDVDDPEAHIKVAYAIRDRRKPERERAPVEALQVVLADRHGAWPWDPASEETRIPLLGPRPHPGEGIDRYLPGPEVRRSQGW